MCSSNNRTVLWSTLGYFVELFEGSSILGFPFGEPVCAAAVDDGCCCAGARKLGVFGEAQDAVLLDECAVGDELLPEYDDERMALLCRWPVFENGGRILKHDEAVWDPLAASLCGLDAAEQRAG